MTKYSEAVSAAFMTAPSTEFGSARPTAAEFGALRRLYEETGRDRLATYEVITEQGFPLPAEVTPEDVAMTAVTHACGVAVKLAESRGPEGAPSTYESYTIKNRFDRLVETNLPKKLRADWSEPLEHEPGFVNLDVKYPHGVDERYVYGIGKPHRYLPAQTMRYLEFARLGKLDEKTAVKWGIDSTTDLEMFGVEWGVCGRVIAGAKDVTQLAGDIGGTVADTLLYNGLSAEQVAAVLRTGYDRNGPRSEHGDMPQINDVYGALLLSLYSNPRTYEVADLLRQEAVQEGILPYMAFINEDGTYDSALEARLKLLVPELRKETRQQYSLRDQFAVRNKFNERLGVEFTNNLRMWFIADGGHYSVDVSTMPAAKHLRRLRNDNPAFYVQCQRVVTKSMTLHEQYANGEISEVEAEQFDIDQTVNFWVEGLLTTKAVHMMVQAGANPQEVRTLFR